MNFVCSRCKKRMAVVFMTRMEGDKTVNEGLCLKCAKELGIQPVNEMMEKMGITDEEIEAMGEQMADSLDSLQLDNDSFEMGGAQAQPFPFLQQLFGGGRSRDKNPESSRDSSALQNTERRSEERRVGKECL